MVRGFDHVKVSEIAAIVGVSEKTVYNYFPTKESLLFDRADETIERLAGALRERRIDEGSDPRLTPRSAAFHIFEFIGVSSGALRRCPRAAG